MSASPSYAALPSPRQNRQLIVSQGLTVGLRFLATFDPRVQLCRVEQMIVRYHLALMSFGPRG